MEQSNNFIKGLHSDFNEQNQPENTYRDAYNWIRNLDGSLSNERGTTASIVGLPEKKVLGGTSIEDELVLFFEDDEIGYVFNNIYYSLRVDPTLLLTTKINSRGKVNYKGDRIIYFVDGINDDRCLVYNPSSTPKHDSTSDLELQINSVQPRITLTSIDDNGSLPTGVYQFSCRLVTASGNKTQPSLMSNPVSITNEVGSTSFAVDGAPPQTNGFKSITITIDNIDPKFNLIEIIATTYVGVTNTPRSNVVGLIAVTGESTTFTYSSEDQNKEEVTLDELTIEPINYKSSSLIELKDNYLFRGNVKTSSQDLNFQQVANNAVVKYTIKSLPFIESLELPTGGTQLSTYVPYKNPLVTVNIKGYQRGEVYSLAIIPKFKSGGYGWAYHIPCTAASSSANTITKLTGKYTSTSIYPEGYGYPTGNVTHHRMPTLSQEPMYDGSNVRILGLQITFDLFTYLTEEELSNIDGVLIVRQRRTNQHKSIITQGIAQNLIVTGGSQQLLMMSPWHGKPSYVWNEAANIKRNYVGFYSPETFITQDSMSSVDNIVPVASVEGITYMVGNNREGDAKDKYAHMFMNWTTYEWTNRTNLTSLQSPISIDKNTIQYIPSVQSEFRYTGNNIPERFSTKENNGYLFFKTNSDLPIYRNESTEDNLFGHAELSYNSIEDATDDVMFITNGYTTVKNQNDANNNGNVSRLIYNLTSNKTNQYGDILGAEYILVSEKLFNLDYISEVDGSTLSDNVVECFNGDIFINKVGIVSTTSEVQDGDLRDERGLHFRTLNYIFLESSINTSLRHYITGDNGTIPYYPKYTPIWSDTQGNGILNVDPYLGHSNGYNKQYSFDNGLKKFFSKSLLQPEEQTNLTNRVIYSEVSIEGEQYDANRVFLPNNYHDIPRSKGELKDMFVLNNVLYLHTPQTLYRTFTNEQTTMTTSSGQVSLGNGGLFPRPSIELTTINGGYGGSLTQNGCNTPYGRLFLDQLQKKIFILSDSLKELTVSNISKILLSEVTNEEYVSGYDYINRRWILASNSLTLSYMPELDSFTCYHNYHPHIILTSSNRVYLGSLLKLEELNTGVEGNYFGVQYPSSIEVISNDNSLVTKSFDNLFIQSTQCLSSIKVVNESKESTTNNLILNNNFDYELIDSEVLVRLKNNQYQLALPRAEDESRFKSKWVSCKFTYDNDSPINLKYLTMLYRIVAR